MQAASHLHLVTDGKSIYLEDKHERIIDILKNARQPMFLVCVSDQARRLDGLGAKTREDGARRSRPAAQPASARRPRNRLFRAATVRKRVPYRFLSRSHKLIY